MSRTARASVGGMVSHVLNRGNARSEVFHQDDDYAAFLKLLCQASGRLPMRPQFTVWGGVMGRVSFGMCFHGLGEVVEGVAGLLAATFR